jgi:PilZ domain
MDKRKCPRFLVRFRSSFSTINVIGGEGSVVDLSIRGCRVESLTDVQPGASLDVRIHTDDDEPPIKIQQAVVRWSRAKEFGLEFVTMAPEEWARLQHAVKQIEMEPYQRQQQEEQSLSESV